MMTLDQKLAQAAEDAQQMVSDLPVPPFGKSRTSLVLVLAAAVVVVVVGGLAFWLGTTDEDTPPVITQPSVTTTSSPTTTTTFPPLGPQALTLENVQRQAEFVSAVAEVRGGCGGDPPARPFVCEQIIDSPLLDELLRVEFTVKARSDITSQGEPIVEPDYFDEASQLGAAARQGMESELAALYTWALTTYPEDTERQCQVGFRGNATVLAWEPGYTATGQCGMYLAGLINEYRPLPPPRAALPTPSSDVGHWYQVDIEVPESVPDIPDLARFGNKPPVFWDVEDTPVGLVAPSIDGLWVSQDGVVWEPFARESVNYASKPEPAQSDIARIASSELGTLVVDSYGDGWFSPDAETWIRVEDLDGTLGGYPRVAASPEGFVVSGLLVGSTPGTAGVSWYSANGIDWQETLTPIGGPVEVEATPFGFFAVEADESTETTRIRSSTDGGEWNLAAELATPENGPWPGRLAGSERGIVAVGASGTVWYSPDGQDWTEGDTLEGGDEPNFYVGASDTGFFAATAVEIDFEFVALAAWYSQDGLNWSLIPNDSPVESGFLRGVVPLGEGFLVVGDYFMPSPSPVWIYEQ